MEREAKRKQFRMVLAGGGSGGHVFPLLAVSQALQNIAREKNYRVALYYLGPRDEYQEAFAAHGVALRPIAASKLRRYFSLRNIIDVPKFLISIVQAFFTLFFVMPDAIFSKGGPGALAVVVAGWLYRIPILIHESDAVPGLTNALSSRFARRIAVSFPGALRYFDKEKAFVSGSPLRSELLKETIPQEDAKESLGFAPDRSLVLILGGSLGSERLNEFILLNLKEILGETQLLHQTGEKNYKGVGNIAQSLLREIMPQGGRAPYRAAPFLKEDLRIALAACDCVVSRAGSSTLFEIAAFGKPAILIPLPESANDHQRANAYEFAHAGGGIIIEESNLVIGIFLAQLKIVLHDEGRREKMEEASLRFFKKGGAERIAEEIFKFVT